jgi:hypothetical protein
MKKGQREPSKPVKPVKDLKQVSGGISIGGVKPSQGSSGGG